MFDKSLDVLSKALRSWSARIGVALTLVSALTDANAAQFFRVVGPTATKIKALTPDGYITWDNALSGTNYTVQTAEHLGAASNWVDFIQVPASNSVVIERLFDPKPPTGMVLIPAGSFMMGNCMDPAEGSTNEVLHEVYVSEFYMDQTPVTSNLWVSIRAWNGGNGYGYDRVGSGEGGGHPVQNLFWYDMVKWCNARSEKEALVPCYYTDAHLSSVYKTDWAEPYVNWNANGYRLPTEAEWEKAARGGLSGHRFPWGDVVTHTNANYYGYPVGYDQAETYGYDPLFDDGLWHWAYTNPVGYFAPNGYRLYDMAGNVSEWCWDWFSESYYFSSPQNDPTGPASGLFRVIRGGGWASPASELRCACRSYWLPYTWDPSVGFRCVKRRK
jgi:formylglycine-generating enzyme